MNVQVLDSILVGGGSRSQLCLARPRVAVHKPPRPGLVFSAAQKTRRILPCAVLASLNGTWVKDDSASESPDSVCDLFELGFVIRRAIGLVKTMELVEDATHFTTRLKALVLSIDERYAKSGEPAAYNRRDLRPGKLIGQYGLTAEGHPSITAKWEDPVKGQSVDVFKLSEDGQTLVQETTYVRQSTGESASYKTVHRRQRSE